MPSYCTSCADRLRQGRRRHRTRPDRDASHRGRAGRLAASQAEAAPLHAEAGEATLAPAGAVQAAGHGRPRPLLRPPRA